MTHLPPAADLPTPAKSEEYALILQTQNNAPMPPPSESADTAGEKNQGKIAEKQTLTTSLADRFWSAAEELQECRHFHFEFP